ncbi:hypothetical protein V8E54_012510 [Elaphomyces granulatus]
MPQPQPQRILEKSGTVRRRYQRSNKRFEFTASQIERIEREQERERRAQKLREQEKKRKANKKKKEEREAKAREERKRLGLPDPNVSRVPASQPLLSNFFGKNQLPQSPKQGSNGDTTRLEEVDSEDETDIGDCFEATRDSNHQSVVNNKPGQSTSNNDVCFIPGENCPDEEKIPIKSEEKGNGCQESKEIENSQRTPHKSITRLLQSFDDDTSVLLEELCEDTLDEDANDTNRTGNVKTTYNAHLAKEISNSQASTADQLSKVRSRSRSLASDVSSAIQRNMSPDNTSLKTPNNKRVEDNASGPGSSPVLVNICQDPEDVLAGISTQDLADDNDEFDDNKENIHPNIIHGQQSPINTASACQPESIRKREIHARREPLLPVGITGFPATNNDSIINSPLKGQRTSSHAGTTTTKTTATVIPSDDDDDDEFDDELGLTMEELQELGARCSSLFSMSRLTNS